MALHEFNGEVVLKRILVVCLITLISACSSSDNGSSEPIDSFEYEGDWGRAFLLYDDRGQATCIKEIVSITETTWKVYQFLYLDEGCESFLSQVEFEGDITAETDEVVDGLSVKRLLVENIDWVWMGSIEPFLIIPNSPDKAGSDALFAISKAILWDTFKVEAFELNLFQDGDSFFSNIFTAYILANLPSLVVDDNSINLDAGYIKIESIDKAEVEKLEP